MAPAPLTTHHSPLTDVLSLQQVRAKAIQVQGTPGPPLAPQPPSNKLREERNSCRVLVPLHGIHRPPHRWSSAAFPPSPDRLSAVLPALLPLPEAQVSSWPPSPAAAPPCAAGPPQRGGGSGAQPDADAALWGWPRGCHPVRVSPLCPCPRCALSRRWVLRRGRRFACFPWKIQGRSNGKERKWRTVSEFHGSRPSSSRKTVGEVKACRDGVLGHNQEGAPSRRAGICVDDEVTPSTGGHRGAHRGQSPPALRYPAGQLPGSSLGLHRRPAGSQPHALPRAPRALGGLGTEVATGWPHQSAPRVWLQALLLLSKEEIQQWGHGVLGNPWDGEALPSPLMEMLCLLRAPGKVRLPWPHSRGYTFVLHSEMRVSHRPLCTAREEESSRLAESWQGRPPPSACSPSS